MKFRTAYNGDSSSFISDAGSPYLDEYEYEIDKAGVSSLVKNGKKKDVYAEIQADYDSTDINVLMKRFAFGDLSAINVKEGFYADVSEMPKTIAELFDRNQDCEEFFATLPVEVKQMFNNSYTEFFTELNSDEKAFSEKIAKYNDQFIDHSFDIPEDENIKDGDDVE